MIYDVWFPKPPHPTSCCSQGRALAQQLRDGRVNGHMTICEPGQSVANENTAPQQNGSGEGDEQMETDEDFARQLQAKMDAEEARRGCVS
jgi:hypothetical protein